MEWFNELIGFLIIIFLFLFPLFRKWLVARHKKKYPQEHKQDQEQLQEIEEEEEILVEYPLSKQEATKKRYTTQRLVKKDYEFLSEVEKRELESKIEARHLETKVSPKFKDRIVSQAFLLTPLEEEKRKNPITVITQKYSPQQTMVILSEILGRSKEFPE